MKLNIKKTIFALVLSFFIITPNVYAEVKVESREPIKLEGKTVYKVYDNLAEGKTNVIETTGAIIKLDIDGTLYYGYCIDFGVSITAGTVANTLDLYKYYEAVIGKEEATELVKKIVLYARLGYGSEGKTSAQYYLATQQLIWETINDTGFYQSDFYEGRAGEKFNIVNLGWTTDKKTKIDIEKEINAVRTAVNNYYITPSLCSSQNKLEIEVGSTEVYTDNNNVLSAYQVVCSNGLECTKEGNKLSVTATKDAGNKTIKFVKPSSGTENIIYRSGDQQGIITNTGILETLSCEFGVNSFQNVQTSDMKIIYISIVGLFCGVISYIIYKTKHS